MKKEILTHKDFDEMKWHDSFVYGLKLPNEFPTLTIDIDYIFSSEYGDSEDNNKFWISPCNLTFENVSKLRIDLNFNYSLGMYILEIRRYNKHLSPNGKVVMWTYRIDTDLGYIEFESTGYIQKILREPSLNNSFKLCREFMIQK